ncbi:MAG: PEP-CTERM sorting domain-containing protein [Phycisphaerae bacterium]|nr:PEP-CTERM sorting domain-containing protein [Phycisphaerae bacterium]
MLKKLLLTALMLMITVSFASAGIGPVREWSSDTPVVPGSWSPIGGSGQVNGNFMIQEEYGIQIGIRASRRFSPDPLVILNDYKYQIETGESAPGQPLWNYEINVDMRGSGYSFKDFDIALITNVPNHSFYNGQQAIETNFNLPAGSLDNLELVQMSMNPGFFDSGIDPFAQGRYDFELILEMKDNNLPAPSKSSKVGLPPFATAMTVEVVPEPTTMALLSIGGLMFVKRKRK